MPRPKLVQQVFEARYEKGYRYLDRAGEAMLILEEALPSETGRAWMQEEIAPTAARLKCPDLDIRIIFNSYHMIVDQEPADPETDLAGISAVAFATLSARFDLRRIARFGFRSFHLYATDSIEEAEAMAVRMAPFEAWPVAGPGLIHRSSEAVASFEAEDGSEGFRISLQPAHRVEAPQEVDPRLRLSTRFLEKGQKQALIDQLHRKAQRGKAPLAGVLVDVDYFSNQPAKPNVGTFIKGAADRAQSVISALRTRSS